MADKGQWSDYFMECLQVWPEKNDVFDVAKCNFPMNLHSAPFGKACICRARKTFEDEVQMPFGSKLAASQHDFIL